HVTGIWQQTSVAACRAAHRAGIPYVVSPRGALGEYSWGQKTLKKKLYYWLFENRNVNQASAIHYTSMREMRECRRLALKPQWKVVPNGLDLSKWHRQPQLGKEWRKQLEIDEKDVVYLNTGRLHHVKGLDLLPAVLKALPFSNWKMIFI